MSEPLLTKDAINIAGHKLPLPLIGALAAVAGVVLVLRARQQSAPVASVGATPTVLPDTASVGVLGQGQEAQLANLSQQLGTLSQQLNTPVPVAAPAASFGQVTGDIGGGFIHTAPNPASGVLGFFSGSPLQLSGPAVSGGAYSGSTSPGLVGVGSDQWLPVRYGGATGYIWAPEARVTN